MDNQTGTFLSKSLANVQLDVSIAAYTKVPMSWNDEDYTTDFNKLYFIKEGEGYVKVNNETFYPKPGELYLLPSGSVQSYGTINKNTFGKYWCHFTAKIGDLHLFQLMKTPVFIKPNHIELEEKFQQLIMYIHSDHLSSTFRVHSILLEIIAIFIEKSHQVHYKMNVSPSFEKLDAILAYIEEHLDGNVTVGTLAQMANFHPNYFISVFKNFTGSSPIQYINRRKIEKAKELLVVSERTVSAISESVGMELSYFSRMFKDLTGLSPTSFRELAAKSQIKPK
ncbi:AraC family transcriptional regulator [Halalkalibacter hemicellulosilyticus]|uniref:Transcriptional regulator n=1 Tax=Halalkalibacter hemicellulosilyticusJCM 9152 TaxID=1236971 RepID=W4QDE8_9BACI|nr:AraC family transcriptional regulator [Halalkalibacter hemicellulosilyticus]GAE29389.1 transcriptional regulator [Halalkalibacter hemicellulosilyticusJCM 9152]